MNGEPDWALYRSFHAVLTEGSLSGAARMLGLTQPSIARHIAALEQAIGTSLFVRSQRGLSPTQAAIELRPHVERLASTATALMRTASARAGEVAGTVRISASEVVAIEHLPPILAGLRRCHPRLSFELSPSNALDDLLQRQADIALRMVPPVQQALLARKIGTIELGLHAHRTYLADRTIPETLEALRHHDLIGFDVETPAIRAIARNYPVLDRAGFALRVDSDIAQLAALRAGFGIGICQVPIAERDPDIVRVLARAFSIDLGLWVVMHEDLASSARCRTVFDALAESLAPIAGRRDR